VSINLRPYQLSDSVSLQNLRGLSVENEFGDLLFSKGMLGSNNIEQFEFTARNRSYSLKYTVTNEVQHWLQSHHGVILTVLSLFIAALYFSWFWSLGRLYRQRLQLTIENVQDSIAEHESMSALAIDAKRRKDLFLSNMSHEMRTPLNGIVGMLHLLDENTTQQELNDSMPMLHESLDRMARLIDDLLYVMDSDSDQLEFTEEVFDVQTKIIAPLQQQKVRAEAKGLEFYIDGSKIAQQLFLGDPHRIGQIVDNLVNNAVKFTDSGHISVTFESNESGLRVVVEDTGEGIDKANLERIFEVFEQGEMGFTKRFQGAGLGLAICRDFTERMGGQLWVESTLGKGSIFYLQLPLPSVSGFEPSEIEPR